MKSKRKSTLPYKEANSPLTEMEQNTIFGIPLKEDEGPVKKRLKTNVKSYLPKTIKPDFNGLPDGML